MTGSGLPHEPPSFINPRVPLVLHGIANHPTQQAFFTAGIKALDASPSLGGDDIPKQVYQTGKLSLGPAKPPERKFKVEEERRREREQKETEERRKQRMIKRRRMRTFGSAIVGGVFGVLFTALRKKQSIKKKR